MKHNYKNVFIGALALLMISAQGVEAKNPPKTKQLNFNHHFSSYRYPKASLVFHNGQSFWFKQGVFYTRTRYGYRQVNAPLGIRVNFNPRYAHRIETRRGVYYKLNGTFYKRSHRGHGFVSVQSPFRGRGHYKYGYRYQGHGNKWNKGQNERGNNQGNGNIGKGKKGRGY